MQRGSEVANHVPRVFCNVNTGGVKGFRSKGAGNCGDFRKGRGATSYKIDDVADAQEEEQWT